MLVALSAAERAMNLARNLRYFAVHTRLDARTADVSQLLLDTVDLIEKDLETHNIKLSVLAEATAYATVDSGAVQQVLLNLITNAIHAMPLGGKLTLSLRQLRGNIEIRCTDTGVGIPAEHLEKVFEPYFATGQSSISESQGLGLAVAKALIEAHGGEIQVDSDPSSGTTFTVLLPSNTDTPKPSPFGEKRRHRRVNVTLPVEVTIEGHAPFQTELSILSIGGCFIRLPSGEEINKAERNKFLSLRVSYYGKEVIGIPKARVATLCKMGDQTGIGVEFLEYDPKALTLLTAIVKSHAS